MYLGENFALKLTVTEEVKENVRSHIKLEVVQKRSGHFIFQGNINIHLSMSDKPGVSEVTSFDPTNLKHVETVEKNLLPTSDGECFCSFMTLLRNPLLAILKRQLRTLL